VQNKFDDDETFVPMGRHAKRGPQPHRRGRLTEFEKARLALLREDGLSHADEPKTGDRLSTWDRAEHGPTPTPDWVITNVVAEDTELGVLKTGKEADVHLLRREIPDSDRSCLLAAKRYRNDDHRQFHRDAQYLEGRRVRRSREMRAMSGRTSFGRNLIAEQWAAAEFVALGRLWSAGVAVPYPVQRDGTEILLEFLGTEDGTAAPRMAQLRPEEDELRTLWNDLIAVLAALAREGLTHGDLSAYNVLVHEGAPILIDLPQVIDIAANPGGPEFLARDVRNIASWFIARGLAEDVVDTEGVTELLLAEAGLDTGRDHRSGRLHDGTEIGPMP
jgi:RIO kinase 1